MIDWDNDYKAIISVIEDSTKFLENSMNFKDLDTFVENQRMQCESISLEEKVFKIPFEDLWESGTSKWAKLINTNCKVQIYRLDNPNLFQVKFDWIANSSKTWTHDLRINIYFKKDDGTYVPLNNKPCLMTSSDLSILICNFDISKCQENSELKEDNEGTYKLNLNFITNTQDAFWSYRVIFF